MPKRLAVFVIVVLLSRNSAFGGEEVAGIVFDGDRAKEYVATLSTDAMEGRMTCTEGYRKAADWTAARFKEWGLQPAGEEGTYFQNINIRGFDWSTGTPTLSVGGRDFLFDDGDYSVNTISTPGITQRGEVVFVGYGIAAPKKGLDEYDAVDVSDKVVLVLKGSPKDAPRLTRRFSREEETKVKEEPQEEEESWKEESTEHSKIRTAYQQGAAAVLLYDPEGPPEGTARRGRSSRRSGPRPLEPERDFLCFTIQERVFRAIMRQGLQESPRGLKRRIDGIRRQIKQKKAQPRATGIQVVLKGYDVSLRFDEEHGNNVARNVLAKIEGTDPELKKEYVLVGAHLDHIGVRDGYVCNGADDNASGSAVVLEVARVLSQAKFKPRRTLIFCCWCGEELGLIGSKHYTNEPCDGVTMDKVVAYFNVDMVGMGEALGASGALNFPSIWEVIQRDQDPDVFKRVKPSQGGPGGSDHTGFIKRGIEAMMLMSRGGVGHQDYHQPEDDTEKIEPEMLRVAGQFVLQGMVNLANETKVNLLIARRQQRYRAMRMKITNFNPQLADSAWTHVQIKKKSQEALYDEIYDRARELLGKKPPSRGPSGSSQDEKKSLARGLADLKLLAGDVRLLQLAVDFFRIGRVDIQEDDGVWVEKGRLTDDGRDALKALEESGVVVRLVSPSEKLIRDMLSAGSKPFIITGEYEIDGDMADRLNARGVLLGIHFDPQDVGDFVTRLENTKERLGERRNLFAFLTATKGLDEAKRPLYLRLIDGGWTHNEICGGRDHRGLVGGASLNALGGR